MLYAKILFFIHSMNYTKQLIPKMVTCIVQCCYLLYEFMLLATVQRKSELEERLEPTDIYCNGMT